MGGVCRLAGHTGDWTTPDAHCSRVRTCTRCGEVTTRPEHTWDPYGYLRAGRCEQSRRCQRCDAVESRVLHAWGPWRYVGPDRSLLRLHQDRTCRRCGTEEETEFQRAF